MEKGFLELFSDELNKIIDQFKRDVASVRGARPTPLLVEDIRVDYFDQSILVKQLASISVIPPRELQVQVWDSNAVAPVENAIKQKTGIQTARDGNTIHCILPELTQERKVELVKVVRKKSEDAKIRSRVERDSVRDIVEKREKGGEITEDDKFVSLENIQKEIVSFNEKLEKEIEKKIREINF